MRLETNECLEQAALLEGDLVRRARKGDEQAFREIVERYQGGVFGLIAAIVGSAAAADDIAQAVFAKLYRSLPGGGFQPSLAAWVYHTGVSESFDHFRKHQNHDRARSPEDRRATVVNLLAALPEEERDLLILKEVQRRSVEELARITNSSVQTVSATLFRARQRLLKAGKSAGMFTPPANGSSTGPGER